MRSIKDIISLSGIFDMMMKSTDYEAKVLTLYGGERRMANLKKMREIMEEYSHRTLSSISSFMEFCSRIEQWEWLRNPNSIPAKKIKLHSSQFTVQKVWIPRRNPCRYGKGTKKAAATVFISPATSRWDFQVGGRRWGFSIVRRKVIAASRKKRNWKRKKDCFMLR